MAYREIITEGDPILRKKSKPIAEFDKNLWELIDDMAETMYKFNGVGVAAPQVGVLKRIVVIDVNNMYVELINPEITSQSGETIEKEGCLSVPGVHGKVARPQQVTVKAQDRRGNNFTLTGENWLARCLCHEIDHLDGILYTDKVIGEIVDNSKKSKGNKNTEE